VVSGAEPPRDLARLIAAREAENREARGHYTYRQMVQIEEFDRKSKPAGLFRMVQDIVFSPSGERTEQEVGRPLDRLQRLRLTEEDYEDIRSVQPFLFTTDELWLYETRFKGEENVDGMDCWVMTVRPRQVLTGQRLFDGTFWVHKADLSVVRSHGRAVPQILSRKQENLFPAFTTLREKVDGKHWFPVHTHADDVLPFSSGALRMRMTIQYSDYKRFGAESVITFEEPRPKQPE
jgi:hypothetical protein